MYETNGTYPIPEESDEVCWQETETEEVEDAEDPRGRMGNKAISTLSDNTTTRL